MRPRWTSGKSVLAAKLVCEDCGSFFGSKVWHSTDKYRRAIWRCNSKFDHAQHCQTPTLDTETVQRMFLTAYNRLMAGREDVIDSCELVRSALVDFAALDAGIQHQTEEAEVVAELVRTLVKENAATAQDQEVYRQKYESLTRRHEAAMEELDRLKAERAHRQQQDKEMARFIRTLKAQRLVLTEWDNTVWTVMVEKAIVHRDGSITFIFYNGTDIKVGV